MSFISCLSFSCFASFGPVLTSAIRVQMHPSQGHRQLLPRRLQLPSDRRHLGSSQALCSVQNVSAPLISGAHCRGHVMPVLVTLHSLSAHQCVINGNGACVEMVHDEAI